MYEEQLKDIAVKFDLHLRRPAEALYSFHAAELLDEAGMRSFAESYKPLMKALDAGAVGAYFAGWLASVALAVQYSLSFYPAVPVIALSDLDIHLIPAGTYCRIAYSLRNLRMEAAPEDPEARACWRDRLLTELYRDTIGPLFETMTVVSGLPAGELWGQFPSKFNYYLEMFAAGNDNTKQVKRLQADYEALKGKLPGEIFGLRRNPFQVQVRWIQSLADPEQKVQMKTRCCLYYRTEGGSCCFTCPRLKEEERERQRTEYRQLASAAPATE
ncbi:(2Fe-2S)-binding protein [Paenibacillus sp. NFR01]|uniref:(2Fe-2S)-binding protein n=1 Tax=Paenibacillus sp. NFR01 TaxID=1566279 RepID=UPI0008C7A03A|nr:(2Fe-2S)-binding protein [Paenibacillus sp. NFR01]SET29592.1 hypothetical protein SAMN03159358_1256 [Paenibacillus sp. NFR01]